MSKNDKVDGRRASADAPDSDAVDDAPIPENRKVLEMSAAHSPQDRLIALLERYQARAAAGEIVGVVITYVRADGGWGTTRDLAAGDMRAAIGELQLAQHDLIEQLVEARAAPAWDRRH